MIIVTMTTKYQHLALTNNFPWSNFLFVCSLSLKSQTLTTILRKIRILKISCQMTDNIYSLMRHNSENDTIKRCAFYSINKSFRIEIECVVKSITILPHWPNDQDFGWLIYILRNSFEVYAPSIKTSLMSFDFRSGYCVWRGRGEGAQAGLSFP